VESTHTAWVLTRRIYLRAKLGAQRAIPTFKGQIKHESIRQISQDIGYKSLAVKQASMWIGLIFYLTGSEVGHASANPKTSHNITQVRVSRDILMGTCVECTHRD